MSHALSDDQVSQELKKMTAFIKQEAMEKGLRQETSAIDTQYEKKFKTARMSQQITQSTVTNKTRLKVLSARQELLDGIFEKAQGRLKEATQDKGKYTEILKNLLLEGMYALNEGKVQVRGRKQDYDVIKKAIEDAQKEYKEKTKKDIVASIDEKNPLPEES
ncbi:79553260-0592-4113-8eee-cef9a9e8615f [Sclerotinia trifoliorum]|uniref:79553260-0592-4113-8eee-cef9a9e8615f n=1 Tax=Sclerotinia trifoliorum TaxID=28548 RepID=A0A8H2VWU4_9HELO|nr:79553260-0592-4113-8eee-cef9a9e8615f [Sclerotinia trifoliorum]